MSTTNGEGFYMLNNLAVIVPAGLFVHYNDQFYTMSSFDSETELLAAWREKNPALAAYDDFMAAYQAGEKTEYDYATAFPKQWAAGYGWYIEDKEAIDKINELSELYREDA